MNFDLARQILRAAEAEPDGCLKLRGRTMVREAELMQKEGWLQLADLSRHRSGAIARLTDAGQRVNRLFKKEAIAQRLRDAFVPRIPTQYS